MNRKATIVRMLIASSGVIFFSFSLIKEWKLALLAIVPLAWALIYGIFGTAPDTSEQRLKELLTRDNEGKKQKQTPNQAL